jgi:hypothetical protein
MKEIWTLIAFALLALSFGCTSAQPEAGAACTKEQCLARGAGWIPDYNGATGIIVMPGQTEPSVGLSCSQFSACLTQGDLNTKECANKYIGYTVVDANGCAVKHVAYYCQAQ